MILKGEREVYESQQDRANQKDLVAATINAKFYQSKAMLWKIVLTTRVLGNFDEVFTP